MYEVFNWYRSWLAIGGWQQPIPPATMRAHATLGHPNIAAAYLNLILPLGLAYIFRRRKLLWPLLIWAGLVLTLVYFTSSRGGWLGTMAASGSLALLLGLEQRAQVLRAWGWLRARVWALAGLILAGVAGAGLVGVLLLRQSQHPTHAQGDQRGYIWVVALDMFKAHPLLGNGPGTYGLEFLRRYSIPPGLLLAHAHNFALNTLGEMGVIGALALAALAAAIVISLWRAWRGAAPGTRALKAGLIASLVGLAVHSQFDTPETVQVIDLLTAVILGLLMAGQLGRSAAVTGRRVSWPLWLGMLAALGMWGYANISYAAFSRGLSASYQSDWSNTARWMDESVRLEPRLAFGWFQDGFAHGMLALNPDGSLRDRLELQKALAAYERGILLDDSSTLNWTNLGRLRLVAGDLDGALLAYTRAAGLAKNSPDLQFIYARVLEKGRSDAQAMAVYSAALELQRALRYNIFVNFSMLYQVDPGGPLMRVPVPQDGWLALEKGDFTLAAQLFRERAGVNDPGAYFGLGRALAELGDYPGAERALRTAEFAGGDLLAANQAMVWLYERMGDPLKLAQAKEKVADLLNRGSVFGPGRMGEAQAAWYIYHRESLAPELLPGMSLDKR